MPESHKAERARARKANRDAGIGDEEGRIVREKDPVPMAKCTVCNLEVRMTKTNTELRSHAESKHGSSLEVCFPAAAAAAAAALAASAALASSVKKPVAPSKKATNKGELSSLLAAGLAGGKTTKKK